jgi:adenylate cyclase
MKFVKPFLLFFLLLVSVSSYGRKEGRELADSLVKELRRAKEDTNKVNILNTFYVAYKDINPDSGLMYAQQGLALADKLHWEKGIADANNGVGFSHMLKLDYLKAVEYFQKAMAICERTGYTEGIATTNRNLASAYMQQSGFHKALEYYFKELKAREATGNKLGIAVVLGNIALAYYNLSDFDAAVAYDNKALRASEEIGDKYGVATISWNLGELYESQGKYPLALTNFLRALKIFEEIGEQTSIAIVTGDIGNVYDAMGDSAKAMQYFFEALNKGNATGDKYTIAFTSEMMGNMYARHRESKRSLGYFETSLKLFEEMQSKNGILSQCMHIGTVYTHLRNYALAAEYLDRSLRMAGETGDRNQEAAALVNMGALFLDLYNDTTSAATKINTQKELPGKKYQPGLIPQSKSAKLAKAIEYLERATVIASEIRSLNTMRDSYHSLADAYKIRGDYKRSLEYYSRYAALKDSISSDEIKVKIMRMGMERESEKKIADAEKGAALRVQRQRVYTFMGMAGVALLLCFSFFIVRERRKSEVARKKSDDLLLNILPAEVADELKAKGNTTAKQFDDVTVLFTDFVNFTGAGEKMDPQSLVDELHTCFKKFDEITDRYNIEKIKTIGDAYLAVGGLPLADASHAENVVKAAIDIGNYMKDREAKLGNRTFQVRIGIHSGSVVAGIVGVKKFAYDIWGDTVNTAARMQQSSEPGRINISETTYDLVKDHFGCAYRGEIDAKNKGQLKMYYVFPKSEVIS